MCNFHSICVRVDGVVGHLPTNSHSGIIAALKWRENEPNTKPKFVEVARKDACPVLMRLVDGIVGRFGDAATDQIRGVLADIIKAPTTR